MEMKVHLTEMEDPLMMDDPWKCRNPLDTLVVEDHQALKDPWMSKTSNSTDSPSNLRYISIGEYL